MIDEIDRHEKSFNRQHDTLNIDTREFFKFIETIFGQYNFHSY